jgi:aryl-alcohol dehydrogenase-like predicted oxidoreductase
VRAPGPSTVEQVDRVMTKVRLAKAEWESKAEHALRAEHCREAVADALRRLHNYDVALPGAVRAQLRRLAKNLRRARVTALSLPSHHRHAAALDRMAAEADAAAEKMTVGHTGGAVVEAERLRLAAALAFDLLQLHWMVAPSLTKSGPWHELTRALHRVATGKRGDAHRAITHHMRELEADGFPAAEERQKMKREGKRRAELKAEFKGKLTPIEEWIEERRRRGEV